MRGRIGAATAAAVAFACLAVAGQAIAGGTYEENVVVNTASSRSRGAARIKFIGNTITKSGSGLHTDNNGGAGGVADIIEANKVDGTGAITSEPPTVGALITTDQLGFEFADVKATLTGNQISGFRDGTLVTQSTPTSGDKAGGQATATAHCSSRAGRPSWRARPPGTGPEGRDELPGQAQLSGPERVRRRA